MVSADCLVLLSDIDGLYTAPPSEDPGQASPVVTDHHARDRGDGGRRRHRVVEGGMKTKIEAAKIALGAGTHMVITSGKVATRCRRSPTARRARGSSPSDPLTARRSAGSPGQLEPKGHIYVDAGAEKALAAGKSLLPAGVARVEGAFDRGDAVDHPLGRRARARSRAHRLCGGDARAYHRQEEPARSKRSSAVALATSSSIAMTWRSTGCEARP